MAPVAALAGPSSANGGPPPEPTVNHAELPELAGPFSSGPEVTKACLSCHTEAAKQVQETVHWTWTYAHPETGQRLGKRWVTNSFCGNVRTNEPRCTSCHNGYGWEDEGFDFEDETLVDCLSCHDTTGTYTKAPKGAGRVLEEETTVHGEALEPPDLGYVARHVGAPTREACGSCHFNGGGGDGSKHGDLDSSLIDPPRGLSVHMSSDGADLACQDCHVTRGHQMAGGRYEMTARDREGTGPPGLRRHAATCASCHGNDPHDEGIFVARSLNRHANRVSCQACHIPRIARGGVMTKVWWDWSKAGRRGPDGERLHEKNEAGRTTYWSRWGEIRWREDYRPSYAWFDGTMRYTMPGDPIDTSTVVAINHFEGGPDDPDARIWPFKIMRGKQPYDPVRETLVLTHLFGRDDTAYWRNLEWTPAVAEAMAAGDLPFSGEVGFVETKMYWAVTHMVAPAEDALACGDCHRRPSVMAGIDGVYLPGRDAHGALDVVGRIAVLLTVLAVAVHAALRIVFWYRRRRS
jgi:octaheme c-type cytochrome (tetrathionate reductase family)